MIHQLKQIDTYFEDVISGKKTFEIRLDDRHYKQGDYLALNEIAESGAYTGRSCMVYVDYVLKDLPPLLPDGVVCMAIKPCRITQTQRDNETYVAAPRYWNDVPVLVNGITEGILRDPKKVFEYETKEVTRDETNN